MLGTQEGDGGIPSVGSSRNKGSMAREGRNDKSLVCTRLTLLPLLPPLQLQW